MLNGLDAIDWEALDDAFGSSGETPRHLRALLSDDASVRAHAIEALFGSVWHQGTIYSVSAHVVPFLVELLAAPDVKDKEAILILFGCIAGGRGYYEVHRPVGQAPDVVPDDGLWSRLRSLVVAKRHEDNVTSKRLSEKLAVDAVRLAVSPHIPYLVQRLGDSGEDVRSVVAQALPFYPEYFAIARPALERALAIESDSDVREIISESLGAIPI